MDTHAFDAIVIGAGIVGATTAAHLAADRKVALVEAEDIAGYHTTGRSAAIYLQNYGPPDARALTAASRAFFDAPPAGFAAAPLLSTRGSVYIATAEQVPELETLLAESVGMRPLPVAELTAMVPALRPGHVAAAVLEEDAADMDVAAMHQGFLALHRRRGGIQALRSRAARIERQAGAWEVEVTGGATFHAPLLVNAAGAWGDEVATLAGAAPVGLVPKRRTACIIDPQPYDVTAWPMLHDMGETWYCRPEARTKLMVSPADETPSFPHDIQPDELDVAIAIDNMQQVLDIEVRRVERSWAGLRTFAPDRSMVIGFDPKVEGFLWCVGQGGYGIQTSPAVGALVADLAAGRDPGALAAILPRIDPARFTT